MLQPRKYQTDAIDAVVSGVGSGTTRQVVVLPTGTGKTLTALLLAAKVGPPVLWLAHRDELIQQPIEACRVVWPEATRGVVKANSDEWAKDIVFASIQTASRDARLERLARRQWSLVVVDECHHAPSASWRKVVEGVGCLSGGEAPPLLGLTATPERLDSARMDDIFQRVAYQYHLHQAIRDGYLAPPEIVMEPMHIRLDGLRTTAGDFNVGELDLALLQGGVVKSISEAVQKHAAGRKTLVFTVSVQQAELVAEALRAAGIAAGSIDGGMGTDERRYTLRKFKSGEIRVLANCAILTEGFDEPTIDCIVMARPTQSKSLFIQCVGRGLRLAPGKQNCRIIDMVALSDRHTLVQAPVIFGADIENEEKQQKQAPLFKTDPIEYWRQRLSTQILGIQSISRSEMRWIRGNSGELLLGVGNYGTVRLRPALDEHWWVEVIGNRETKRDLDMLSDMPVGIELAQGLGEDYVRRCKAVTLARGGRWADQPATDAQLEALRRWKVEPPAGLSKGQASDMLTQAAARTMEPATEKQLSYLRSLGREIRPGLTKREAGRLIGASRG